MVVDLRPGSLGASPTGMVDVNGMVVFTASDDFELEVWRSDGTPSGTTVVHSMYGLEFVCSGPYVFFRGSFGNGANDLWSLSPVPLH
jgi:ELWxxDGT repeat protein